MRNEPYRVVAGVMALIVLCGASHAADAPTLDKSLTKDGLHAIYCILRYNLLP